MNTITFSTSISIEYDWLELLINVFELYHNFCQFSCLQIQLKSFTTATVTTKLKNNFTTLILLIYWPQCDYWYTIFIRCHQQIILLQQWHPLRLWRFVSMVIVSNILTPPLFVYSAQRWGYWQCNILSLYTCSGQSKGKLRCIILWLVLNCISLNFLNLFLSYIFLLTVVCVCGGIYIYIYIYIYLLSQYVNTVTHFFSKLFLMLLYFM